MCTGSESASVVTGSLPIAKGHAYPDIDVLEDEDDETEESNRVEVVDAEEDSREDAADVCTRAGEIVRISHMIRCGLPDVIASCDA